MHIIQNQVVNFTAVYTFEILTDVPFVKCIKVWYASTVDITPSSRCKLNEHALVSYCH